jgi:hypothetical protein
MTGPAARSGILVARAWRESGARDGIRVRVICDLDPAAGGRVSLPTTIVVDGRAEFLSTVADWFDRTAGDGQR